MNEIVQLNDMTIKICNRLDEYINNIKKDMVIGDVWIIKGVELVSKFVKDINPDNIDNNIINDLKILINNYINLKESNMVIINKYMNYGIDSAYNIVLSFVSHYKKMKIKSR